MSDLRLVEGQSLRFFRRGAFGSDGASGTTSLGAAEKERWAGAVKAELSAIHHGRLQVTMRELQALRLLVAAHGMGQDTRPLFELTRDAKKPGLLPRMVLVQTVSERLAIDRCGWAVAARRHAVDWRRCTPINACSKLAFKL